MLHSQVYRTFSLAKQSLRSHGYRGSSRMVTLSSTCGRSTIGVSSSSSIRSLSTKPVDLFTPIDQFEHRHIGPSSEETKEMLNVVGCSSLDELIQKSLDCGTRDNISVIIILYHWKYLYPGSKKIIIAL